MNVPPLPCASPPPPLRASPPPVGVDARKPLLAMEDLAAVGSEPALRQALAGVLEGRLVGEDPDHAPARVGEGVGWGVAGHSPLSLTGARGPMHHPNGTTSCVDP